MKKKPITVKVVNARVYPGTEVTLLKQDFYLSGGDSLTLLLNDVAHPIVLQDGTLIGFQHEGTFYPVKHVNSR